MNNSSKYSYNAFGMNILSDILLPELQEHKGTHDVRISKRIVEGVLDGPENGMRYECSDPSNFIITIRKTIRFNIKDGNSIIIEIRPETDEKLIRLFLLGTAFAALIHQKMLFPLHGSAIRFNDAGIVFTGPSGAGKSTIAAAFSDAGYDILCDDICVINLNDYSKPLVYPAFPQMKLWKDSVMEFQHNEQDLKRILDGFEKFAVPMKKFYGKNPLPLHAVFLLEKHDRANFAIEEVKGIDKFKLLFEHTYRPQFINLLKIQQQHFTLLNGIGNEIKLFRIIRPDANYRLNEMVTLIIETLNQQVYGIKR